MAVLILGMLSHVSCLKRGRAYGTSFIKGRVVEDSSGAPKANFPVYLEYVYNASNMGGSYERDTAGLGVTDSAGYFLFEYSLYAGVEYKIKPWGYYVAPAGKKDTTDMGVLKR